MSSSGSYVLSLFSLLVLSEAQCYYVNGALSNDTPCQPTAGVSSCCLAGWVCLSNGMCSFPNDPNTLYRGSCTDRSWRDAACGQFCPAQSSGALFRCSKNSSRWCCDTGNGRDRCSCSSDADSIVVQPYVSLKSLASGPSKTSTSAQQSPVSLPSTSSPSIQSQPATTSAILGSSMNTRPAVSSSSSLQTGISSSPAPSTDNSPSTYQNSTQQTASFSSSSSSSSSVLNQPNAANSNPQSSTTESSAASTTTLVVAVTVPLVVVALIIVTAALIWRKRRTRDAEKAAARYREPGIAVDY